MENSFSSIVESSSSILILLPTKPYFDQVAAGLSLFLSLKEKKNVTISCPSQMIVEFNRLVGIDRISSELGNKNLTMKFCNYNASDIEKVSYDIEKGEFRLTIIPKVGFSSPKKEDINFLYTGVSADTLILIGGGNISHFPSISSKEITGSKIVHIGLRDLAEENLISFDRPSSSVSEIIANLLEESGFYVDPDIATNLLAGIEDGSGNFSSPEVSAETFQIVANLIKAGGRRTYKEKFTEVFKRKADNFPIQEKAGEDQKPPKDWLEPKIYKGTTVS